MDIGKNIIALKYIWYVKDHIMGTPFKSELSTNIALYEEKNNTINKGS